MIRAVAAASVLALSLGSVASARTLTLDDVKGITAVSDVQMRPGGRQILYVVSRGDYGKADRFDRVLMLYDLSAGSQRALTFRRDGLQQPAWSPDGSRIAFLAQSGSGSDAREQLWVMNMRGGDPRAVTDAPQGVLQFAWRPDGGALAYVTPDPPQNANAAARHLDAFRVGNQAFNDRSAPAPRHLWLVNADGTANERLTQGDWSVVPDAPLSWSADGTEIAFERAPNAYSGDADAAHATVFDVRTGTFRAAAANAAVAASPSGGTAGAFAESTATRPSELYYRASPGGAPMRLTDYNGAIAALDLGTVESVAWKGPDGSAQMGTLTYPPNDDCAPPKKPCALVLLLSGGPNDADGFGALAQLLAARGYLVLQPASTGRLGERPNYAVGGEIGESAAEGVMAGVAMVEARGIVDRSRVAVSGWSYGGYMTAWLIGHYHVWKAAVAGAPLTNWVDQYVLSQSNVLTRYRFGGATPFVGDGIKLYVAQSPMTYAWGITTPTLILADVNDARVPITQSYDLYHALADRGTAVQFFAYPVSGHFPADPVRRLDVYRRWIAWLAEYLK